MSNGNVYPCPTFAKACLAFDEDGRMKPSSYCERVVDVMEELMKLTLLSRSCTDHAGQGTGRNTLHADWR